MVASCSRSVTKMEYYLVEFVEEGTSSIIPARWLVEDTDDKVPQCWWPKGYSSSRINKAIQEGEIPNSRYVLFAIKLLTTRGISDYHIARAMLKVMSDVSDMDADFSSDMSTPAPASSKRSVKRPSRFIDRSMDKVADIDSMEIEFLDSIPSAAIDQSIYAIARDRPITSNEQPKDGLHQTQLTMPPSQTSNEAHISTMLERILQEQMEIRHMMQDILIKLDDRSQTIKMEEIELPADMHLPVQTLEELEALDRQLADPYKENCVIRNLLFLGGDTSKEFVRNVLAHVMVLDVALQFTWLGTAKKKAFRDLRLYNLMIKLVRRNPPIKETTVKEINFCIREFFRTASDRNGGRLRRRVKTSREVPS